MRSVIVTTVITVDGTKPFMGIADDVEKIWKKLKARFGVKERRQKLMTRTVSHEDFSKELDKLLPRRGSEVGSTLSKFKQLDKASKQQAKEDVYSPDWKPPKFDKNSADYGRPKEGSLTEKRGIAAGHHIGKEIVQLCEVMVENGEEMEDGTTEITFGQLFSVYNYISDKVVGMLIRARRHKLVAFEGEMLYQRQDDHKVITLLRSLDEVKQLYEQSDDPALCLKKSLW